MHFAAMRNWADTLCNTFFVDVYDQFQSEFFCDVVVAERIHLLELPRRIDVQQRERNLCRKKSLLRQPRHAGSILADGVEHHWIFKLGSHLANNMDALGFELA